MISEFALIDRLTADWENGREVILGVGDDASAIAIQELIDDCYLQTVDLLVENVHFQKSWGTFFQLGWKSLAVNMSDIAAMGGRPLHTHLALAIPSHWSLDDILAIRDGFKALAEQYQISLLGGDTTASGHDLVISVMVAGATSKDRIIRRNGAKPGDVIWVSGELGEATAGLMILQQQVNHRPDRFLKAFLQPYPEVELGRLCAQSGLVHAMIDISDGLTGDLGHILKASGVGAMLKEADLPINPILRQLCGDNGWDALDLCLKGGESYLLLGTSAFNNFDNLEKLVFDQLGKNIFPIGHIIEGESLIFRRLDGTEEPLPPEAYDHFT